MYHSKRASKGSAVSVSSEEEADRYGGGMMESWIPSKMAAMVRGGGGAAAGSRRKSTAWKFLSGESKRRASTASGREKKRNTLQVNQKLAPVFLLIQEQIFLRYQTRWMGKLIANDSESYQYLVESIRNFPDQEMFLGMVKSAGFENAKYRNMTLGVAALHSGWKL